MLDGLPHGIITHSHRRQKVNSSGSSSGEAESMAMRIFALLRSMISYVNLFSYTENWMNLLHLRSEDVVSMRKIYRLFVFKETTPFKLFLKKLKEGEYSAALSLASTYQLNTDMIYQRQWASAPVDEDSIKVRSPTCIYTPSPPLGVYMVSCIIIITRIHSGLPEQDIRPGVGDMGVPPEGAPFANGLPPAARIRDSQHAAYCNVQCHLCIGSLVT